ncbi:MAG: hypothetical protein WBA24_02355 [Geitlerinemataceae cyanobacterium]
MSDSGNSRWQEHFILWRPVVGLAVVQGSIVLSWVIYRAYLGKLLTQWGFPESLADTILLVETLLAIVLEPLMGGLSDRLKHWMGTRFPLISLGVILSSALFIAIPASVAFGTPTGAIRWILPSLAVAWALAMTMFRSPVIALLIHYAAAPQLPRAASVRMLITGTMGAFAPLSNKFLLSLGPGITFAAGSIVMLLAVKVLRSQHPPQPPVPPTPDQIVPLPSLLAGLASIVGLSMGTAWGFRFLASTLSQAVVIPIPNADLKLVTFFFGLIVAVGAFPAGILATKWGNVRVTLVGIGAMVYCLLFMGFVPYALGILLAIVGLVATFSLVNNGAFCFIFEAVPPHRIGLGIGTYFGSYGAASILFSPLFGSVATDIANQATYCTIAFLMVGLCMALKSWQMRNA